VRDVLISTTKQLAAQWNAEAASRRRFTPNDAVADAIEVCASELVTEMARVDQATRLLTPEEYAKANRTTASTVRRCCARGELAGEKNAAGDWMIPRDARRVKRA
jgi:hypothetical protein